MFRVLPSLAGLSVAAFPAVADVSVDDAALLDCAARALVLSAATGELVEFGAELPEGLQEMVETRALDLLDAAQPLFADGVGGNAEMSLAVDRANDVREAAGQADTSGQWYMQSFVDVQACHAIHLPAQVQAQ